MSTETERRGWPSLRKTWADFRTLSESSGEKALPQYKWCRDFGFSRLISGMDRLPLALGQAALTPALICCPNPKPSTLSPKP
eukprot:55662-Rhodomonas_salina.1